MLHGTSSTANGATALGQPQHQPVRTRTTWSANMRRPTGRRPSRRSPRPRRRSRPGRGRPRRRCAPMRWTKIGTRDPGAQGRARPAAVARGGQDAARGHRRGRPRRADLQVLRRRGAAAGRRAGASVRPGIEVEITREPVGVVGLITPWNFPIAIPAWKIAPALAYGNCVVFKPADLVPGSAWALAEIISRAGLPDGRVQPGHGPRLGGRRGAGRHRRTSTPSASRARSTPASAIAPACVGSAWRKFQLEMGGKNPLVVLDDADLKTSRSNCAVQGAFFSTGQRCTASARG